MLRKRAARVKPDIKDKWSCTTTTRLVTRPCQSQNFWQRCPFLWSRSLRTQRILVPITSFSLFKVKKCLKDRHFGTMNNIQKTITVLLKSIPISEFQHFYEEEKRFRRCVASQGNYFEMGLMCNLIMNKNAYKKKSHYFLDKPRTNVSKNY